MIRTSTHRPKVVIAVALTAFAVGVIAFVFAQQARTTEESVDFVERLPEPPEAELSPAVAEVNGQKIRLFQLQGAMAMAEVQGVPVSAEAALDALIDNELLYVEALDRGLEATDEQVHEALERNRDTTPAWVVEAILEYNEAAGHAISADDYWEHPEVFEATRKALTIGNLQNEIRADSSVPIDEALEATARDLRTTAEIVIHHSAFDSISE